MYKSEAEADRDIHREWRSQAIKGWLCKRGIHLRNNYIMRIPEMREDFHWQMDEMPRSCQCGKRWWWPNV